MTGPVVPPGGEKLFAALADPRTYSESVRRLGHEIARCHICVAGSASEGDTQDVIERHRAHSAVPPGGEELRKALAEVVRRWWGPGAADPRIVRDLADAVLALPEMRDALAAQKKMWSYANDPAPTSQQLRDLVIRNRGLEERLRRVEELAHAWEHPLKPERHADAARLRRALDGDS